MDMSDSQYRAYLEVQRRKVMLANVRAWTAAVCEASKDSGLPADETMGLIMALRKMERALEKQP
jgi:hypothetical protein